MSICVSTKCCCNCHTKCMYQGEHNSEAEECSHYTDKWASSRLKVEKEQEY